MSYFTETMGNLLHQTAFFNLTWGNYRNDLSCMYFPVSGDCKRV